MKKLLYSLLLIGLIIPAQIRSQMLDNYFDIHQLKGAKIGYYIGSFDPLHLGHQRVIDQALNSGHVDYLLIYPVPGGDQYKNRTGLPLRLKMIASVYQNHPRVLFTHWSPKELQDRFSPIASDIDIIGIIGSDLVTETLLGPDKALGEKKLSIFMRGIPLADRYHNDTIGSLMALKANSFLVALRGEIDLSHLDGMIADRPIRAFIQSGTISSTQAKLAIQNKHPFAHFFSPEVTEIIMQEELYNYGK